MHKEKPYIDFSFLGVSSFIELLTQAGTEFELIEREDLNEIYNDQNSFIRMDQDTILMGKAKRDGAIRYFIEFGIMIAPDIQVRSYIVFIFDKIPEINEIRSTIEDIEVLINEYMENNLKDKSKSIHTDSDRGSIN